MRDEQSFLAALRANPEDDQLRLVYADWLEERCDARGEYLRVRCALKALPADDERRHALRARLRELRPVVRPEWLASADRLSAEDDVREAVFRHQLGQGGLGGVYFLQAEGGSDPSPELLERFRGFRPPVRPASAARRNDATGDLVDDETGEWGALLWIDSLRWTGLSRCEVSGGNLVIDLSLGDSVFQVELCDGRWSVTDVSIPRTIS